MFAFIDKIRLQENQQPNCAEKFENLDLNTSALIYGDNEKALTRLLSTHEGKVDLVYIDPPFNTNQIFAVSEGRNNTISRKRSGKIAYSDQMNKEDFLLFMYKRFSLIYRLLSEKGSLYVHIDDKMGSYFKVILDEIFGDSNFKNEIIRIKSNPKNFDRNAYGNEKDVILFYAKNATKNIWNDIRISLSDEELIKKFPKVDGSGRHYNTIPLHAPGESSSSSPTGQAWRGLVPPEGRHWRTNPSEFDKLDANGDIEWSSTGNPRIKKYATEHKGMKIQDIWTFKDPQYPDYPTEKNYDMLDLIVRQSSNSRSIVMDCFAGSGSFLLAAAKNNRIFIGIDKSKIALKVEEQKLKEFKYSVFEIEGSDGIKD